MKLFHMSSKQKAKGLALNAFNKMEGAMQDEIKNLMAKYTELRNAVKTMIENADKQIKIIKTQEIQIMQRDRIVELLPYE